MSVMTVAEIVRDAAKEHLGSKADIKLVENPRSGEAAVEEFDVDIFQTKKILNWPDNKDIEEYINISLLVAK